MSYQRGMSTPCVTYLTLRHVYSPHSQQRQGRKKKLRATKVFRQMRGTSRPQSKARPAPAPRRSGSRGDQIQMQLGEPRFSAVAVNVAGAGFETPKKVMVLKFFFGLLAMLRVAGFSWIFLVQMEFVVEGLVQDENCIKLSKIRT